MNKTDEVRSGYTALQVAQAAEYEELAARILTRQPIYLAAPRGTIRDRNGIPLLTDEPSSDVAVHYALLSDDDQQLDHAVATIQSGLGSAAQRNPTSIRSSGPWTAT